MLCFINNHASLAIIKAAIGVYCMGGSNGEVVPEICNISRVRCCYGYITFWVSDVDIAALSFRVYGSANSFNVDGSCGWLVIVT